MLCAVIYIAYPFFRTGDIVATVLYYFFCVGFTEELFFRAYLIAVCTGKSTDKIIKSAIVFSFAHVLEETGSLKAAVIKLILITIAGILFGSVYVYTGNLLATITVHGIYDITMNYLALINLIAVITGFIILTVLGISLLLMTARREDDEEITYYRVINDNRMFYEHYGVRSG